MMKRSLHYLAAGFIVIPLVYLLLAWPQIPATVPLHYNLQGTADRYGSKNELLRLLLVLAAASALIYLMLCNVHRIDPRKAAANKDKLQKMGVALALFFAVVQCWIVYSLQRNQSFFAPRPLIVAGGLLLSVVSNYLYNLKPNYFAGIRLPWTLEDEENWRKTHHLAGKLLFAAGIIVALAALFLSLKASLIVFALVIFTAGIVPVVYSYKMFQRAKP